MTTSRFTPNASRYFKGTWTHPPEDGVGLELWGEPTDWKGFLACMQDAGCNPPAARRILDLLVQGQTKRTTVSSSFDFNEIGDNLAKIGVLMLVIPPAKPANQELDAAVLSLVQGKPFSRNRFTAEEQSIIESRNAHMQASLVKYPFGLGRFS